MKYILTFLLIIASLNAKEFSVIIDKPFNEALFDITQDYDRSISAVGFTKEYTSSNTHNTTYTNAFDYLASLSDSYGSQISLLKVDNNANVLIDKANKMPQFSEAIALVKTPTNGYFVGGYTLDGSLIILKLDLMQM